MPDIPPDDHAAKAPSRGGGDDTGEDSGSQSTAVLVSSVTYNGFAAEAAITIA